MARIRIGFVGLSVNRGWAKAAHLPYLSTSPHYEITGVVNSSLESSEAAIKEYGLSNAKGYASVAELVRSDVDLVVVSVKGPQHYEALVPALEAGKDVYVEWPLAFNLKEAEELAKLAKEKGVRSMVGAQGGVEPAVRTVKGLLDSGAIGHVISSEATLVAGHPGGVGPRYVVKYLLPMESRGVYGSIYFPHCMSSCVCRCSEADEAIQGCNALLKHWEMLLQYPVLHQSSIRKSILLIQQVEKSWKKIYPRRVQTTSIFMAVSHQTRCSLLPFVEGIQRTALVVSGTFMARKEISR